MSSGWQSAEDELRGELESGERLLWAGQPRQGIRLQIFDLFAIPFSLLWGGFAIAWEVMAFVMEAPWFFKLWGIPFVLVGLYMLVGRFYVDARRRAAAFQGITTTSLLFISGRVRRVVQRIPLRNLGPLSLQERGDGSGVIGFSVVTMGNPAMGGVFTQIQQFAPQGLGDMHVSLEVQEDVRGVYRRLRDAIEEASRS
jgi:hypothetical protein